MKPLPDSVAELLEELEGMFPPRCKSPEESLELHARYAGAADLVATLRIRRNWTLKNQRVTDIDTQGI